MKLKYNNICQLLDSNNTTLSKTIQFDKEDYIVIDAELLKGSVSEAIYESKLIVNKIIIVNPYFLYYNLGVFTFLKKLKHNYNSDVEFISCGYPKKHFKTIIRYILVNLKLYMLFT